MRSGPVLLSDLDNTLFNWIDYFAPSFRAMVHALAWATRVPESEIYGQFKAVYGRHELLEYTFAIQELEMCRDLSADRLAELIHVGRVAFGGARRKRLQPYDGVAETLGWLRRQNVTVIGISNSAVPAAIGRLRALGIERYFDGLVAWDGMTHPAVGEVADGLKANLDRWRKRSTIPRITPIPEAALKPSPEAYVAAFQAVTAPDSAGIWAIGDSITKDLVPAREIGAATIWARYGQQFERSNFDTLLKITFWGSDRVKSTYDGGTFEPDVVINSFRALRGVLPASQGELFPDLA